MNSYGMNFLNLNSINEIKFKLYDFCSLAWSGFVIVKIHIQMMNERTLITGMIRFNLNSDD